MRSDRAPKRWFRELNKKYFNNLLPDKTIVYWGSEEDDDVDWELKDRALQGDTELAADPPVIRLSPHFRTLRWYGSARFTLAHEACHLFLQIKGIEEADEHGPAWEAEMRRLAIAGAFQKSKNLNCLW